MTWRDRLKYGWSVLGVVGLLADAWLQRLVTRIAHGLQRTIGATSFRQAVWLLQIARVTVVIRIGDYWLPTLLLSRTADLATVLMGFVGFLWVTLFMRVCRRADESHGGDTLSRDAQFLHEQASPVWLRLIMIGLTVFVMGPTFILDASQFRWLDVVDDLGGGCMAVVLYVSKVLPLPPAASRLQDLVAAIGAACRPTAWQGGRA